MTASEDWWLHPPTCGHWTRATDLGLVRMGARAKGKRLTIRCPGPGCDGKLRWAQVVAQEPGWAPPA